MEYYNQWVRYEVIMLMSLIRPEDFLANGSVLNPYWAQLLNTVDEFDQLMELEKREITTSIRDFNLKRVELVKQFSEFKDSLRFEGEVPKQQVFFLEMSDFASTFRGYHHSIIDIIEKVILSPKIVAELLGNFIDNKRVKFQDFFQNIVFNIYPYYLPKSKKAPMVSFVSELFEKWPYSTDLVRPTHYTLIDQAIGGLMKAPEIVCYIEKIISYFLQEAAKCKMSAFAFDEQAINSEIQIKRQGHATFSHQEKAPEVGWRDKLKGLFKRQRKNTDISQSRMTVVEDPSQTYQEFSFLHEDQEDKSNLVDVMLRRQTQIFDLISKTGDFILTQQMPIFLCRLLACFDQYLDSRCQKDEYRLKHYCYFIMTNLILAQLHNKFTVSHQETVMAPADLQNISEIIKFLNALFQGVILSNEKYKIKTQQYFYDFLPKIQKFYDNALCRGKRSQSDEGQLLQNLLVHYQRSIVLSMNDLHLILIMLKMAKPSSSLPHPWQLMEFLKNKEAEDLFDLSNNGKKTMKVKGAQRSFEHTYLVYECRSPSMKQIIDFYLTIDEPMAEVPFLRQLFLGESNLLIQQTLEIDSDLRLIRKLPIKEIRGYLGKIAHKFKDLRVKDGRQLQDKFQQSFKSTLARSLLRKEWLLYYRSQLSQYLSGESELMTYFTGELNSGQFYERMANAFCQSVKLKVYLNIQDNVFCIHKSAADLKKIQISTLMVAKDDSKSNSSNENYILRNSFKIFQNYKDLIRCLYRNQITMAALAKGRRIDQFNSFFQEIANIIVQKIGQFVAKRQVMQMLSQEKLALIVVKKMQDRILERYWQERIPNEFDHQLLESSQKVNKNQFWEKDLKQYELDRQFIVTQGVEKLKEMQKQTNVWSRLRHFGEFFKIIFTILGFTMPKNKISAQIVTPLVQYIILQCAQLKHHECLFSILALKWKQSPEDSYHLTLYQSSLNYIRQLMAKDYPL